MATTGAPAATGRTRSTTDAVSLELPLTASAPRSRRAALEALADLLLRQIAPDEHDAAFARLAVLPRPLVIAVEDHVDALEHEALRVVLERQDALRAQDARAL